MDRIVITKAFHGIFSMQVCAEKDVNDEEVLEICNRENPSGTTGGWCEVVRNDPEHPQCNPVECSDDPDRFHFLVHC